MGVPGARPAFAICVALSIGAHALLLAPWPKPVEDLQRRVARFGPLAVQARLVLPPQTTAVTVPPTSPLPADSRPPVKTLPASPRTDATRQNAPTAPAVQPAANPVPAKEPTPIAESSSAGMLDGYVPRPLLTEPPILLTPVTIEAPADEPRAWLGTRTGVLAIYINEDGRVQAAEPEEPRLPPAYEQAAQEAFLSARYTPGRINERAVRSRLRVEIEVDGDFTGKPELH